MLATLDLCRATLAASPLAMAAVEGPEHIVRYVNPAFCVLVGKSEQELLHSGFSSAVEAGDECLSLLDRVHRTGRPETLVGQIISSRFHWSVVSWPILAADESCPGMLLQVTESAPVHPHATAMNEALLITSLRQHEMTKAAETLNAHLQEEIMRRARAEEEMERRQRQLEASERRYRGLIEAIPQIVWTATPRGTLDFANSKWFEFFGLDLAVFNDEGWPALLHPDDRERSLRAWANGLRSGTTFEIEHRLRNAADGNFRWYLSRAAPLAGESDAALKWFGTSTDLEEQKRIAMALFASKKLDSLGMLAGGIAHDFNNLLCGILGGAHLIAETLPETHAHYETLRNIVHASERAAHLTRQMLAYAGKGQFFLERVDLNEMIQSTCDLIRLSLPGNVQVDLQMRARLPMVEADAGQMRQLVMNLILNAVEAIEESGNGSVIVKTDLLDLDQAGAQKITPVAGAVGPGSWVVAEVRDNGCGMDEATMSKILDPFFTTKFTGRGLGLSAVGGILRSQKGGLETRSTPGKGSTFRVFLPALAPSPTVVRDQAEPTSAGDSPARPGAYTILVVDDEELIRKMTKLSLENAGFTVHLADSGQEAIRILSGAEQNPISLVVLDLTMPGMNGRQVMERIRELKIEVPVLICSGYSEADVAPQFSGLGVAGFIGKPFTPRQLANRIRSVLDPEQRRE